MLVILIILIVIIITVSYVLLEDKEKKIVELQEKCAIIEQEKEDYNKSLCEAISRTNKLTVDNIKNIENKLKETTEDRDKYKTKYDKLNGELRSKQVKLGLVTENIMPFLESFPYDTDNVRGLFNPIDLIVFNDDEVVFVEVKSGGSRLSNKQKKIKDNIQEGRVRFEVHKLSEEGYEIKE